MNIKNLLLLCSFIHTLSFDDLYDLLIKEDNIQKRLSSSATTVTLASNVAFTVDSSATQSRGRLNSRGRGRHHRGRGRGRGRGQRIPHYLQGAYFPGYLEETVYNLYQFLIKTTLIVVYNSNEQ